jgi:hypothetical protein
MVVVPNIMCKPIKNPYSPLVIFLAVVIEIYVGGSREHVRVRRIDLIDCSS